MNVCGSCGSVLTGRSDRRYCSAACRKRAHRQHQLEERRSLEELVGEPAEGACDEPWLVGQITAAAATNWRAAAWLLERRYPERWGLRSRSTSERSRSIVSDVFAEVDELAARRRVDRRRTT
jgi:hypothetical protein